MGAIQLLPSHILSSYGDELWSCQSSPIPGLDGAELPGLVILLCWNETVVQVAPFQTFTKGGLVLVSTQGCPLVGVLGAVLPTLVPSSTKATAKTLA